MAGGVTIAHAEQSSTGNMKMNETAGVWNDASPGIHHVNGDQADILAIAMNFFAVGRKLDRDRSARGFNFCFHRYLSAHVTFG